MIHIVLKIIDFADYSAQQLYAIALKILTSKNFTITDEAKKLLCGHVTLVKLMDDYRDWLIVILADYSSNIDDFLLTNAILKSLFPQIIDFPDYVIDELLQISHRLYATKGYSLTLDAKTKFHMLLQIARQDEILIRTHW